MPKKNIPLQDIIELHNQGLYDREIAEIFGCTRHNITQRLNKAGIIHRKSKIDDIDLRNRISNSLKGRFQVQIIQIIKDFKMKSVLQEVYLKQFQKR